MFVFKPFTRTTGAGHASLEYDPRHGLYAQIPHTIGYKQDGQTPVQLCFEKQIVEYGSDFATKGHFRTTWTRNPSHVEFMDTLVKASNDGLIEKMEWNWNKQWLSMTFKTPLVINEDTTVKNAYFWY